MQSSLNPEEQRLIVDKKSGEKDYKSDRKHVPEIYNRGTGAGGAKTTHNGKEFESKTDMSMYLYKRHKYKPVELNDIANNFIIKTNNKVSKNAIVWVSPDENCVYMVQRTFNVINAHNITNPELCRFVNRYIDTRFPKQQDSDDSEIPNLPASDEEFMAMVSPGSRVPNRCIIL